MTEQMKNAWAELEEKIGSCCLHKKAALNELSKAPLSQLTLVTSASSKTIEAFLGKTTFEHSNNRYVFTYNGVNVELTTLADITDIEELYRKSFCHTLTIDSVGIRLDGAVTDCYGGVADIQNRVLRMTPNADYISESLAKRIFSLILSGYSIDDSVRKQFEARKTFEKPAYRKCFFEALTSAVYTSPASWGRVASLISVLGSGIEHKKAVIGYTVKLNKKREDKRFRLAFLFLIFAMMKAPSKEIVPIMKGEKSVDYYDSVCTNFMTKVSSFEEYAAMKRKYGRDFSELLYDVQEIWMNMENIPYTRPTEKDFNMMSRLISDEKLWSSGNKGENPTSANSGEKTAEPELEGTIDFNKMMSGDKYKKEDYDEPMEGIIDDPYEICKNDSEVIVVGEQFSPEERMPTEAKEIRKKAVCIDDEIKEEVFTGGLDTDGLAEYEAELNGGKQGLDSPVPVKRSNGDVMRHSREHTSKVLTDGGK